VGSEWLDSECKNAHFQAFPQSTPSAKFPANVNDLEIKPSILHSDEV
jgi:hypothetical protein